MILSNIKSFIKQNKKIFFYLGFFLVVFGMTGDVSLAEDNTAQSIAKGVNAALSIVTLLLGIITYLATMFLSPEWINGSLFGMSSVFKEMWILVSNVVYFVFAFILIWIAFMNIIGKEGDQYQLKQALPKFIVGVLIVPFSWFLVQFILSISAILTVSALTLPMDTFPDHKAALNYIDVPKVTTFNVAATTATGFVIKGTETIKLGDIMAGGDITNAIFGVISMYTHGVIGIQGVDDFSKNEIGQIKQLGDIAVKLIFDVLFVVVYFILIITLGLVLLIRGIYIWIYTMMSPIFGLMYFFDKKEGGEGFFAKFNLKEFIALAMVPVYTMLALSFGLLFIYLVGTGLTAGSTGDNAVKIKQVSGETVLTIGKDSENSVTLKIQGATGTKGISLEKLVKGSSDTANGALGYIGHLILKILGIVVLWGAVMAAMRTSEITKAITEPIHQFGTKVGGIMASAPGNIPVFGGKSASELSAAAGSVQSSISGKISQKGADWGRSFVDGNKKVYNIEDRFRGLTSNQSKEIAKAITDTLSTIEWSDKSQVTAFTKQLTNVGYNSEHLDEATFAGANETKIANMLFKAQDNKMTSNFTSYESYRKAMETNLSSKKGVGDNEEIDRGTEYFKNSKGTEFSQKNIKVEKDENFTGIGRIIVKQKSGIITEHRIKLQSGGKDTTFEKLNSSDKKEIVDFLGKLDGDHKEEINDILKALGLEKLSSSNKNLKDEIEKYSETLKKK